MTHAAVHSAVFDTNCKHLSGLSLRLCVGVVTPPSRERRHLLLPELQPPLDRSPLLGSSRRGLTAPPLCAPALSSAHCCRCPPPQLPQPHSHCKPRPPVLPTRRRCRHAAWPPRPHCCRRRRRGRAGADGASCRARRCCCGCLGVSRLPAR
jgi:hypothetical protein